MQNAECKIEVSPLAMDFYWAVIGRGEKVWYVVRELRLLPAFLSRPLRGHPLPGRGDAASLQEVKDLGDCHASVRYFSQ